MLPPIRRITVRIVADRPRKQTSGWPPRSFALYFVRRRAEAGLLRDGGTTAAEISRYVRELRREVETEVALRTRKPAR